MTTCDMGRGRSQKHTKIVWSLLIHDPTCSKRFSAAAFKERYGCYSSLTRWMDLSQEIFTHGIFDFEGITHIYNHISIREWELYDHNGDVLYDVFWVDNVTLCPWLQKMVKRTLIEVLSLLFLACVIMPAGAFNSWS